MFIWSILKKMENGVKDRYDRDGNNMDDSDHQGFEDNDGKW